MSFRARRFDTPISRGSLLPAAHLRALNRRGRRATDINIANKTGIRTARKLRLRRQAEIAGRGGVGGGSRRRAEADAYYQMLGRIRPEAADCSRVEDRQTSVLERWLEKQIQQEIYKAIADGNTQHADTCKRRVPICSRRRFYLINFESSNL
jgi:hypothetical protein